MQFMGNKSRIFGDFNLIWDLFNLYKLNNIIFFFSFNQPRNKNLGCGKKPYPAGKKPVKIWHGKQMQQSKRRNELNGKLGRWSNRDGKLKKSLWEQSRKNAHFLLYVYLDRNHFLLQDFHHERLTIIQCCF